MTPTSPPPAAPPQNLAFIKLVTAFLGLLLVGGVALLVLLLFLGDGEEASLAAPPLVTLAPGEVIANASAGGDHLTLLIADADGPSRVLTIDLRDGAQTSLSIDVVTGDPLTDR